MTSLRGALAFPFVITGAVLIILGSWVADARWNVTRLNVLVGLLLLPLTWPLWIAEMLARRRWARLVERGGPRAEFGRGRDERYG